MIVSNPSIVSGNISQLLDNNDIIYHLLFSMDANNSTIFSDAIIANRSNSNDKRYKSISKL